ncbi:hypothetical protein HK405_002701, partial [Cladochytrium tenue]
KEPSPPPACTTAASSASSSCTSPASAAAASRPASPPRIVDSLNDHFKATYLIHLADPGSDAGDNDDNATAALAQPSLRPIPLHPGTTRLFFWTQTVAARLAAARSPATLSDFRAFPLDGSSASPGDPTVAAATLIDPGRNWDLADPRLWERYYSPAVMESVEAMGLFVPPDVRRLPSFVVTA